jgi:hypothetical protein
MLCNGLSIEEHLQDQVHYHVKRHRAKIPLQRADLAGIAVRFGIKF